MKRLFDYLKECDGMATPGNTVGMGNPMPPSGDNVGSEPLVPVAKAKKEKLKKKRKI